jgi:hypothetical protein
LRNETRRVGVVKVLAAAGMASALLLMPGSASAQFFGRGGFGGAGSTVQGDILRGEGIAAWGFGQYNLSTAIANSINADTMIKWNQYVYLSIEEDLHKKYLHRMARKERNDANYNKNLERILEKPNPADLRSGDALNFVLMQLIDPRISPSNYRKSVVNLPGDTIRKIPFVYASRAATFSMERLVGRGDWPLSLRGPQFARERRIYEKAIKDAIELDVEGKLTGDAVRAVATAVDDLDNAITRNIPESRTQDITQARNFVRRLADIPRILNERPVERVIAEIQTYPGTSVGDLVLFMQQHNLRFGVAESPMENELYANLFDSLRTQRSQVTLPDDGGDDRPLK